MNCNTQSRYAGCNTQISEKVISLFEYSFNYEYTNHITKTLNRQNIVG